MADDQADNSAKVDGKAPLHFDADYRESVTLRDGSQVHLRLIGPADRELLRTGFERLSPESRYRRFFSTKNTLTERELDYLTDVDQRDHFAVAVGRYRDDGSEEGLGVARFVRLTERPDTAEAAVAVVDDAQGKGLGTLLFQRLSSAARERGVERIRSEVLGENAPMQEMLRHLAVDPDTHVESGVVITEFELPKLAPAHPIDEPPREHAGYKLFKLAANGLIELERVVPWLRRRAEETS